MIGVDALRPTPPQPVTPPLTADALRSQLLELASAEQREKYTRFFPGDHSFVGVRMGDVFTAAKASIAMPVDQIELLLDDDVHEVRVGGCSIMGKASTQKQVTEER